MQGGTLEKGCATLQELIDFAATNFPGVPADQITIEGRGESGLSSSEEFIFLVPVNNELNSK